MADNRPSTSAILKKRDEVMAPLSRGGRPCWRGSIRGGPHRPSTSSTRPSPTNDSPTSIRNAASRGNRGNATAGARNSTCTDCAVPRRNAWPAGTNQRAEKPSLPTTSAQRCSPAAIGVFSEGTCDGRSVSRQAHADRRRALPRKSAARRPAGRRSLRDEPADDAADDRQPQQHQQRAESRVSEAGAAKCRMHPPATAAHSRRITMSLRRVWMVVMGGSCALRRSRDRPKCRR